MIAVRRDKEREHHRRGKQDVWLTFHTPDRRDSPTDRFGALEVFSEDRLPPGGQVSRKSPQDTELLAYVREGTLAYMDSMGHSGTIYAGEFRRTTPGRGGRHTHTNTSRTGWAHFFQLGLRPWEVGAAADHQQRRFTAAERRGGLCLVASPDSRGSSLRMHQDAFVYSALLDVGQHIVHELVPGRSAWIHVVRGEVTLGGVVLTGGDGAGFTDERAVSLTAREESEVLLVDLGGRPSKTSRSTLRRARRPQGDGLAGGRRIPKDVTLRPERDTARVPGRHVAAPPVQGEDR